MPEISLPTKATQDLIKTETDKIASKSSQTSVDAVKTDTAAIKATTDASLDTTISSRQANAGLTATHAGRIDTNIGSRASQASLDALNTGTDFSNFRSFFGMGVPDTGGLLQTVFSITAPNGGFINHLLIQSAADVGLQGMVQIIIDGVMYADLELTNTDTSTNYTIYQFSLSDPSVFSTSEVNYEYPSIEIVTRNSSINRLHKRPTPIFFKNSVVIKQLTTGLTSNSYKILGESS